ncbi:MAG TPA: hypothetical protein VFL83_21985 [Anaeromyxobacter sp.]|nr:hypothetical protein [Anaeromyxobacter sp.]
MANQDTWSGPGRALNIALRTAHLGAMALLTGGLVYGAPADALGTGTILTVATGAALLLSEMGHGRGWLAEGRGLLGILHVAVAGALFAAGFARAGAAAALVVGAVASHLPRSLRRWSWRRGIAPGGEGG